MTTGKDGQNIECGSYKITCLANKRAYYGMSINLNSREINHFSRLRRGSHHCVELQNDFTKYGEKKFKFEVIEKTPDYLSASLSECDHMMRAVNRKEKIYNYFGTPTKAGRVEIPKIITTSIAFKRENLEAMKEYAENTNQSVSRVCNSLVQMLMLGKIKL